ncbi:hypothetical protein SAY87_016755 [Trapa incisa]|uniref:BHLH domain-containing protein n=1 Tax=Trapa incisa TaxID=236973 RepID=A0AAN7QUL9_9MYRT|nr:hypothetical protein SAY87_016755 [Trapa incisa]
MESDLFQNHQFREAQNQQEQQQEGQTINNPGLTRYRSAPSSYFTNLLDREFFEEILRQPSSPERERILRGLMPRPRDYAGGSQPEHLGAAKFKAEILEKQLKQETQLSSNPVSASSSQNYYQSSSQAQLPNQSVEYRAASVNSMGSGSASTGLLRQSSSPAGLLLSNLNSIEGYGTLRGMENFGTSPREASYSPTTRFGTPMNYLCAGQPCSSGHMSPIAEVGNKDSGKSVGSPEGGGFDESHENNYNYDRGYLFGSWDDSGLNALEAEEMQGSRGSPTLLARHLSLPNSSSDIERLLQIQDSVPCKIRAKRGFATHPRSIAERVRRTKISERIRKLQDLVPNMDKQTNTAEMLDSAVEYIKDLQEQVKVWRQKKKTLWTYNSRCFFLSTYFHWIPFLCPFISNFTFQMLSDSKSKCICSNRQRQ